MAITWRNLLTLKRVPQLLIFSTIQPVIFVLLFRYVFGGAIRVPGVSYVDYLMPGIFAQTVAFGSINTGVGLASDLGTGLIERFRSLPMARSAVLAGRSAARHCSRCSRPWPGAWAWSWCWRPSPWPATGERPENRAESASAWAPISAASNAAC